MFKRSKWLEINSFDKYVNSGTEYLSVFSQHCPRSSRRFLNIVCKSIRNGTKTVNKLPSEDRMYYICQLQPEQIAKISNRELNIPVKYNDVNAISSRQCVLLQGKSITMFNLYTSFKLTLSSAKHHWIFSFTVRGVLKKPFSTPYYPRTLS